MEGYTNFGKDSENEMERQIRKKELWEIQEYDNIEYASKKRVSCRKRGFMGLQ